MGQVSGAQKIEASYPWPLCNTLSAPRTALIIIDMQRDFCAPGGWVDQLGEDIANLRAAVAPVARLMDAARKAGLWIVRTREGHRPDLVDLNPNMQWRTRQHGLGIGDQGAQGRLLVRGQTGHDIVPERAPLDGTNMDQFRIGLVGMRSPYGAPSCVFDDAYISGASSSGSAVATALGLSSFSIGNDEAGSGRGPAGFNNIVGIKPTPGLVSNSCVSCGGCVKTLETRDGVRADRCRRVGDNAYDQRL